MNASTFSSRPRTWSGSQKIRASLIIVLSATQSVADQSHCCGEEPVSFPLRILGSFFGLPANPANTPGGTNYAIGGAFNDAILGPGLENLFSTTFGQANTNLPGTAGQIGNYLASGKGHANPNALYLISSGGNNAFYASMAFSSNATAANAFLLPEAQALTNAVAQLQQAGARYIIVANQYQPPSADANAVTYGHTVINATFADLTAAGVKFIPADTASVIAAVEQPAAIGENAHARKNNPPARS